MARTMETSADHPNYDFETASGLKVQLRWQKNEYRAFKRVSREWVQMFLGSNTPDALMEYIKNNY